MSTSPLNSALCRQADGLRARLEIRRAAAGLPPRCCPGRPVKASQALPGIEVAAGGRRLALLAIQPGVSQSFIFADASTGTLVRLCAGQLPRLLRWPV